MSLKNTFNNKAASCKWIHNIMYVHCMYMHIMHSHACSLIPRLPIEKLRDRYGLGTRLARSYLCGHLHLNGIVSLYYTTPALIHK